MLNPTVPSSLEALITASSPTSQIMETEYSSRSLFKRSFVTLPEDPKPAASSLTVERSQKSAPSVMDVPRSKRLILRRLRAVKRARRTSNVIKTPSVRTNTIAVMRSGDFFIFLM